MRKPATCCPDRWLVCSRETFGALRDTWSENALTDGLYRWRITHGYVEHQPLDSLQERLEQISEQGQCRVYLIFDKLDETDLMRLMRMAEDVSAVLELRMFEWHREVAAVLSGLSAPDHLLLNALRSRANVGAPAPPSIPSKWIAYVNALRVWEAGARRIDPEGFDELYGTTPINWGGLLVDVGISPESRTVDSTARLAFARAMLATTDEAATWLRQLLTPVTFQPAFGASTTGASPTLRRHEAGIYTLTIAPAVNDDRVFYVSLEVDEQRRPLACGRAVVVRIGATEYELGQIGEDGIAELDFEGQMPRGQEIEVRINRLPQDR